MGFCSVVNDYLENRHTQHTHTHRQHTYTYTANILHPSSIQQTDKGICVCSIENRRTHTNTQHTETDAHTLTNKRTRKQTQTDNTHEHTTHRNRRAHTNKQTHRQPHTTHTNRLILGVNFLFLFMKRLVQKLSPGRYKSFVF